MKTVQTTARGLVLRTLPLVAPETDAGGRLRPGETATAYGESFDRAWLYVKAPDGLGWAAAAYLRDAPATPSGASWRVARSLEVLREQVNRRAPNRRRNHDGTIGDTAHASRTSDHNPNSAGVVTALDLTHDSASGCDCGAFASALVASKDPRIKYLIFRGQIVSSKVQPWKWRPYKGANAHMAHLHISVDPDPALYDDPRAWRLW